MYVNVPHNDRVYMYTLIHSITLHSIGIIMNKCSKGMYGTLCECACVCVCVCLHQATKVLISKYLATRRLVVSVGGVNGSERQLLAS